MYEMRKTMTSRYLVIFFLGLLVFISHYFQFSNFGLYEDDYAVTSNLGYNLNDVWTAVVNSINNFQRPVGFIVITLIPFISSKFGDLNLLHLTGFLIVWLNAYLVFYFIRLNFDERFAWLGAIFYVLFPALTIRGWLMHTTHMQPTITYLLCALILYTNHRKTLSYIVISLSLMTYELGILPFFTAPMFANPWNRHLIKKLAFHSLILFGMMAIIIFIRSTVQGDGDGDIKILLQNPVEIIQRVFFSMFIGPYTSIKSFFFGPTMILVDIIRGQFIITNALNLLLIIPLFITLLWSFLYFFAVNKKNPQSFQNLYTTQEFKLTTLGFLTLFLSYSMAFTHYPPKELFGTGTSIHTGAAFAWALLAPGLLGLIYSKIKHVPIKRIFCVGLAIYLSILVLFHISIQSVYVKSAKMQTDFWNAVVKLCPDLSEGTVIFYDKNNLVEQDAITTFSWAISVTLEQIYKFPSEWKSPPRVFPTPKKGDVHLQSNSIDWLVPQARWWAYWNNTPISKIIYLRHENNTWVRYKQLAIDGKTIELNIPTTEPTVTYPKGLIWDNFQRP
jgi:hypothetical protein